MNKKDILTKDLFNCEVPYLKDYFKESIYPWDLLPRIKDIIEDLLDKGIPGFIKYKDGVLIGENVIIDNLSTINPPAIIGPNTVIRPGAYIRGNLITGANCVLGNSSEFKNAILLDHAEVPHFNYVGDSILGNNAHMGAGSICSNLKSDKKNIVIHSDIDIETGLRKIGAILGDNADIGCQSVLNPGSIIGKNTRIYPLSMVRGVIPSNTIYKNKDNIVDRK